MPKWIVEIKWWEKLYIPENLAVTAQPLPGLLSKKERNEKEKENHKCKRKGGVQINQPKSFSD